MCTLKDRLLTVEDEFQVALAGGRDALSAFNTSWECLLADIDQAFEASTLDDETASLAHSTALRISFLADISMDVYAHCDKLTAQLVDEVETLMAELTLSTPPSEKGSARPVCKPSLPSTPENLPACSSRKRRRDSNTHIVPVKPSKRPRVLAPPMSEPSPHSTPLEAPTEALNISTCVSSQVRPNKKRRCSDADATMPRPLKRLHIGPRLHAVSDSFPAFPKSSPEALCKQHIVHGPPAEGTTNTFDTIIYPSVTPDENIADPGLLLPSSDPLCSVGALDMFLTTLLDSEGPYAPSYCTDWSPPSDNAPLASRSRSFDSSSSASISPPPYYPPTPPLITSTSFDLPPYHPSTDFNTVPTASSPHCDIPLFHGEKMIAPAPKESELQLQSLGHIDLEWTSCFHSTYGNFLDFLPPPYQTAKHIPIFPSEDTIDILPQIPDRYTDLYQADTLTLL